jgi:hypothetical protein
MAFHVIPVSPALRVEVLQAGGGARPGLMVGVRWNEEADSTEALVITEHGGADWVPHDRIEAGRLG